MCNIISASHAFIIINCVHLVHPIQRAKLIKKDCCLLAKQIFFLDILNCLIQLQKNERKRVNQNVLFFCYISIWTWSSFFSVNLLMSCLYTESRLKFKSQWKIFINSLILYYIVSIEITAFLYMISFSFSVLNK